MKVAVSRSSQGWPAGRRSSCRRFFAPKGAADILEALDEQSVDQVRADLDKFEAMLKVSAARNVSDIEIAVMPAGRSKTGLRLSTENIPLWPGDSSEPTAAAD